MPIHTHCIDAGKCLATTCFCLRPPKPRVSKTGGAVASLLTPCPPIAFQEIRRTFFLSLGRDATKVVLGMALPHRPWSNVPGFHSHPFLALYVPHTPHLLPHPHPSPSPPTPSNPPLLPTPVIVERPAGAVNMPLSLHAQPPLPTCCPLAPGQAPFLESTLSPSVYCIVHSSTGPPLQTQRPSPQVLPPPTTGQPRKAFPLSPPFLVMTTLCLDSGRNVDPVRDFSSPH